MNFDLHCHSHWSHDGENSVLAYAEEAVAQGLSVIAITDHDTADAFPEVELARAAYPNLMILFGVEFTTAAFGGYIHQLCYGLTAEKLEDLASLFTLYQEIMAEEAVVCYDRWRRLGFQLSTEEIEIILRGNRPEKVFRVQDKQRLMSRSWLYRYFLKTGQVTSFPDFHQYEKEVQGRWIERTSEYPAAAELVDLLQNQLGCIVIQAHPERYVGKDLCRLEMLVENTGVLGVECWHGGSSFSAGSLFTDFCRGKGLLMTAGSDSHLRLDLENGSFGLKPELRAAMEKKNFSLDAFLALVES